MNIKKLVNHLIRFFALNRGSGTTTLVKKISDENDVFVIVPTAQEAEQFNGKAITFNQLIEGKAEGLSKKPILLDNHTLIQLLEEVSIKFVDDDLKIQKRDQLVANIKHQILKFEQGHDIEELEPPRLQYNFMKGEGPYI